jgi:putative transposase
MGQATRTTKLLLDLGKREEGGANSGKRAYLEATADVLTQARAFYLDFFLAHAEKLAERVTYYSEKHLEMRTRAISPNELLTWAEAHTVETRDHPHPWEGWNFSERFPAMPFVYRRAAIKDAIGKARSYVSLLSSWEKSGKQKGKPGLPGAGNHPTLYQGTITLDLEQFTSKKRFVQLKVYTGERWEWHNYPVRASRYFHERLEEEAWEQESPKLVLSKRAAELHFVQTKTINAKKVVERKADPDLVTVGVDLNVSNLAVITVRQHGTIIKTVFVPDHGLDQARYRHLKRIAKKQYLSGKPVKGEHSNQQLWAHVRHMNEDAAHKVARQIADVCAHYPGCVLLFERLRKIKRGGGSKSRRINRKQANQLRGKINAYAKQKAFAQGVVTVEVNAHGTSQYCSRCGAQGKRFFLESGTRLFVKWGKLFWCPVCHYQANADFNASVNTHHSFYQEWHWQLNKKPPPSSAPSGRGGSTRPVWVYPGEEKPGEGNPNDPGQARSLRTGESGGAIAGAIG